MPDAAIGKPLTNILGSTRASRLLGLLGLMCISLWLHSLVYSQSFFGDEFYAYQEVNGANSVTQLWHQITHSLEVSPPLYFFLAWLAHIPFDNHASLRIPSVAAVLLVIPAIFYLARRVATESTAWLAAALATVSPFLLFYGGEARPYALVILFGALLPLAMLRAVEKSSWLRWLAFALTAAAALYTHYTLIFALAACCVWAFLARPEVRKKLVVSSVLIAASYLPWMGMVSGKGNLFTYGHVWGRTLEWWGTSLGHLLISHPYAYLGDLPGWPLMIVFGICLFLGLCAQKRSNWNMGQPIGLVVVLLLSVLFGLGAYAVFTNTNLLGTRNFSSAWASFVVVGAVLASRTRFQWLNIGLSLMVVALLSFSTWAALQPRYARPEVNKAVYFIEQNSTSDTILVASHANRTVGYLTHPLEHYSFGDLSSAWHSAILEHRPLAVIFTQSLGNPLEQKLTKPHGGYIMLCHAAYNGWFAVQARLYVPKDYPVSGAQHCNGKTQPQTLETPKLRRETFIFSWGNGSAILPQDHPREWQDWTPTIIVGLLLILTLFATWYLARRRDN